MKIPSSISKLIESFERLPGIGPKTAQRLTFYLLHFPQEDLERFADSLSELKKRTKLCSVCKNVSEDEICSVCNDYSRNKRQIAVVATSLDTFSIDKAGYKGVYHVLHGIIDPLNHIGPEEIFIKELVSRVKTLLEDDENPLEILLATNSSMEGESTALYITKLIKNGFPDTPVKITRLARGLPVGGDIEYADDITLSRALEGRSEVF